VVGGGWNKQNIKEGSVHALGDDVQGGSRPGRGSEDPQEGARTGRRRAWDTPA
jgi:hypothetical protein